MNGDALVTSSFQYSYSPRVLRVPFEWFGDGSVRLINRLAPPPLARYGVGRMEEKATTAPMGEESKVESVDLGEGEV